MQQTNATHAINVSIGLDLSWILSPVNIPGLKLAFNTNEEEQLPNLIAQKIMDDINNSLQPSSGFNPMLINAELHPIRDQRATEWETAPGDGWKDFPAAEDHIQIEDEVEEDIVTDQTAEDNDEDYIENESLIEEVEATEEVDEADPTEEIDPKFIELSEHINNTVFKLESMLNGNIHVYISNFSDYGDMLKSISEVDIHNINRSKFKEDDISNVAYIVTYRSISKEEKVLIITNDEITDIDQEEK